MDADFSILPPAEQEDFVQELDRILDCSNLPFLPAASYPPVTNHFPAAGGASGHVSLGGPDLFGGLEGEFTGINFNAVQNPLPQATLPGLCLSPSSSFDSPSPVTPTDVYGGAAAWRNPATLPNVSTSPPTIDPRLLNATAGISGSSAAAPPGLSTQGLSAAGGNAQSAYKFGEEATEKHLFGFRYALPRDHPNYHRPSNPKPSEARSAFMLLGPQCPPPMQEFAQGSSSSAYPPGWLPDAMQLAPNPPHQSTFYNVATSLFPPSLPNAPSTSVYGGYASTSNAYGGMFSPNDYVALGDGTMAVRSAPSSSLGKRKAAPTNPAPSKRKTAKVSTGSRPSQKAPPKPRKARLDSDFHPQHKFTDKIDRTTKLTWAGQPIKIDLDKLAPKNLKMILDYISANHGVKWDKDRHCRYGNCTVVFEKPGALKAHVVGLAHMDWRRECLRCGFDVREDMFRSRHKKTDCDKKYEKNIKAEAENLKPQKPRRTGGGRKKGGDASGRGGAQA